MQYFALTLLLALSTFAQEITVAAASDLKFAMDEIITGFRREDPTVKVNVVYGSSGKFYTQIRQGAPYDLYFSADIHYPRALADSGFAASAVIPYALGRIVLWSARLDASQWTLDSLLKPEIRHVAIANPKHAPYGKRAEEALQSTGLGEKLKPKLVYGENIAHAAQFVQTGNAQVGIIALSLVLSPELSQKGGYWLIPDSLHLPLEQGFMITKRAADNTVAKKFSDYILGQKARVIMKQYGFVLPDEN